LRDKRQVLILLNRDWGIRGARRWGQDDDRWLETREGETGVSQGRWGEEEQGLRGVSREAIQDEVLVFGERLELGGGQGVEGQRRLVQAKVAQEVLEGKEEVIYTSLIRSKRF